MYTLYTNISIICIHQHFTRLSNTSFERFWRPPIFTPTNIKDRRCHLHFSLIAFKRWCPSGKSRGAADWHTIQISSFAKIVAGENCWNSSIEQRSSGKRTSMVLCHPTMDTTTHAKRFPSSGHFERSPVETWWPTNGSEHLQLLSAEASHGTGQTQMSEALQAQFLGVLNRCEAKLRYLNFQNGFAWNRALQESTA